jgi:uncharacterized protein YPO0396
MQQRIRRQKIEKAIAERTQLINALQAEAERVAEGTENQSGSTAVSVNEKLSLSIADAGLELVELRTQLCLIRTTMEVEAIEAPLSDEDVAVDAAEWEFAKQVADRLQPLIDARKGVGYAMTGSDEDYHHLEPVVQILHQVGLVEALV